VHGAQTYHGFLESLQRSTRLPSCIRGLLLKEGREGKGREERKGKRKGGRKQGEKKELGGRVPIELMPPNQNRMQQQ